MHPILSRVSMYLTQAMNEGVDMPEELIEEFGEAMKVAMRKSFSKREKDAYTIRMSNVGRPLCQQQFEKAGTEREHGSYSLKMKLFMGDMIEAAAIAIMKAAGVNIQEQDKKVDLDIGGINLEGSLDLVIDGKVYDVKSASPYAFTHKFDAGNAFQVLREDDPFGYVLQGYLYSEADDKPFGGWIAINKSTGEWTVAQPPIVDNSYRKQALRQASTNIAAVKAAKAEIERCFELIEEKFNRKLTGNHYLGINCEYCSWKHSCWKDLHYEPIPKSTAKEPKKRYYVGKPS